MNFCCQNLTLFVSSPLIILRRFCCRSWMHNFDIWQHCFGTFGGLKHLNSIVLHEKLLKTSNYKTVFAIVVNQSLDLNATCYAFSFFSFPSMCYKVLVHIKGLQSWKMTKSALMDALLSHRTNCSWSAWKATLVVPPLTVTLWHHTMSPCQTFA